MDYVSIENLIGVLATAVFVYALVYRLFDYFMKKKEIAYKAKMIVSTVPIVTKDVMYLSEETVKRINDNLFKQFSE